MINKLTPHELDRYLKIASWVDDKLPNPIPKNAPSMYQILEITPSKEYINNSDTPLARPRIIPTSKQLTIYTFVMLVMLKAKPKTRELIYIKNFPHTKSYRALKRFYLDCSHEKLRYMYQKALGEVCTYANKNLKEYY